MSLVKIVVEYKGKSKNIVIFNVNRKLADYYINSDSVDECSEEEGDYDDDVVLTDVGEAILEEIAALEGIEDVYLERYSVIVTKGTAFSFEEIVPQVQCLIKRCLEVDIFLSVLE